jgi:pimeloyl-ACP methyl ester carboxylesterase
LLAQWLVSRGFVVVIPQRPGHGQSGGPYLESAGTCESPDFKAAGLTSAATLESVIAYMREQPFVAREPVLLIGHSAGGWASLALAGMKPELVRAVVVFAAGRGGRSNNQPNSNCAPDELVAAAGELGSAARAPVLWVYSENDTYFSPALGRSIAASYSRGGSPSTFIVAPAVKEDGHFFVHDKQAVIVVSGPLTRVLKLSPARAH